jgi:hypothetical protein
VTPASRHRFAIGSQRNPTPRWADTVAAYCICAVIALVPFPFGSMNPRVIAVWVLLLSVILGMASLRSVTSRKILFLFGFATVAANWGFVVVEQMSHAPIFAEQLIDPIWQQTETATAQKLAGSVSVARYQPYFAAGSQIACMLSIAAGFLVGRDRNAAHLLLKTFAGSGLLYAAGEIQLRQLAGRHLR